MVTGKRTNTTVAPQALFMLNDAFVRAKSIELAQKLQAEQAGSLEASVAKAYRSILNRQPIAQETSQALAFLASYKSEIAQNADGIIRDSLAANETESAESVNTPASSSVLAGNKAKPGVEALSTGGSPAPPAVPVAAPEDTRDSEFDPEQIQVKTPNDPELAALSALIQALWASGEFRYVR